MATPGVAMTAACEAATYCGGAGGGFATRKRLRFARARGLLVSTWKRYQVTATRDGLDKVDLAEIEARALGVRASGGDGGAGRCHDCWTSS
jgi:hypothetical protein